jgi:hypothetical protein
MKTLTPSPNQYKNTHANSIRVNKNT